VTFVQRVHRQDFKVEERDYAIGPEGSLWDECPVPGTDVRLLVGFRQSLGTYSLIKFVTSAINPRHMHEIDDESAYVLEGHLKVAIGDAEYEVEPGGFVYMPRLVPHQFMPQGRVVALSIQTPGGIMDGVLEHIGEYLRAGHTLDARTYAEMQAQYGIQAPGGWFNPLAKNE
jgi:mannose-6-phosphate isomerase-like protein (cupin superfamily)